MARRTNSGKPEVTSTQARQGFLDRPVLLVLVGGLVLGGTAFIVAYLVS